MKATTRELNTEILNYNQRIAEVYNPVREVVTDEPEISICRGCGEPDTEETCLCEPEKKLRIEISSIFQTLDFRWMSKDILTCDEHKLQPCLDIAAFFSQSEKLYRIAKKLNMFSYEYKCSDCGKRCIPTRWTSGDALCKSCERENFGH